MTKINYTVIIGDMVASRDLTQRAGIQKMFEDALSKCNRHFKKSLISPLTLTIGDEFQAVLSKAADFPDIIDYFEQYFAEKNTDLRFRYGIGSGTITTAINRKAALAMDGPAFYKARESLEQAKKHRRKFCLKGNLSRDTEQHINLLLQWISLHEKQWSLKKQRAAYYTSLNWTQKKIAVKLKVSQPAVSQTLKDPALGLVQESKQQIQKLLNGY